ncbi:MAG: hypothetical protein ACI4MF_13195 [Candidatus Faecivicinus sp.]
MAIMQDKREAGSDTLLQTVNAESNWSSLDAGVSITVGLKTDGTVVATGYNEDGRCNVGDWTNIVSVSGGFGHTVGLRSVGTVVATGWNLWR